MPNHDNCTLSGQIIGGDGPTDSSVMFVGEAPGRQEVAYRRPFVGAAGNLLNKALLPGIGVERGQVYVTNVVKHWPPGNRKPTAAEIRACLPNLVEELQTIRPKVVVVLGATALSVFKPKAKITNEHGVGIVMHWHGLQFVLVPWFHPAALLRNANLLPLAMADCGRFWAIVENAQQPKPAPQYVFCGTIPTLTSSEIGLDTETTSPTRGGVFATDEARVVGFSVSARSGEAYYCTDDIARLRTLAESPRITKICHNAKFEWKVLRNTFGIELTRFEDTKLAAYLLGEPDTGLKHLARQYLGVQPRTYKEVTGGRDMADLDPSEVTDYAAADADYTRQLWWTLGPKLASAGLVQVYKNIELPLIPVLAKMEGRGVRLDVAGAQTLLDDISSKRAAARAVAVSLLQMTEDSALDSHEQLAAALERADVPIRKRTRVKWFLATDEASLEEARSAAPDIVGAVLDYRKLSKLETYVKGWLGLVGSDGRLHPSFNQVGHWEEIGGTGGAPSTGRLSSSGPNLQNVPHHSDAEWARRIRSVIVPSDGNVLLAADVQQEEPRIIAHVADDAWLKQAFAEGLDMYRPATNAIYPFTVSDLADDEWKKLFSKERFVGKTFVLAWWYGADRETLSRLDPTLSKRGVDVAVQRLAKAHPPRAEYIRRVEADLERDGYVVSLFGRKRWIPLHASGRKRDRLEAVRQGANAIIQMTAADILKMAMVRLDAVLARDGLKSAMVMSIHDELVFDAVPDELGVLSKVIEQTFNSIAPFPLPVDIRVGHNWGQL